MADNKKHVEITKHVGYIALAEAILRKNEHDYIYGGKWQRETILKYNTKNIIRDIVEFTGMDISDYNNNLIRKGAEYDSKVHRRRPTDTAGKADP